MKPQNRLLHLSLLFCIILGGITYTPLASPSVALANTPMPPTEEVFPLLIPTSPPPTPPAAQTALAAELAAWEQARQNGPEAVVALAQTLRGAALDLAMPDIIAAHRQVMLAAPPPPATAPISLAEEEASLQAQVALDAARRARTLAFHDDPTENNAPASPAPPQPAPSSALAADLTVGADCTYATIGAAIAAANPGDTLLIEGGVTFNENLTLPISLTLQGGYAGCASGSTARTTIDGNASNSVIIVERALVVSLQNLNLTNGSTGWEGGGIRFARGDGTGTLHLSNINIYGNTALWGGGLWIGVDAEVTGDNVHIYDNTATAYGGGVRLWGGRATFSDSNIYSNVAPRGAGVYATREDGFAPTLNLPSAADIYDNDALTGDGFGGGVYMREGMVSLAAGSDIYSNNAIDGGGAYLITSTLTLAGNASEIMLNAATGDGGGVYALESTLNLDDSAELYNNAAGTGGTGNGGGAYLDNSTLWGDKALIHYNTTNGYGGGVYATNGSLFDMDLGGYTCAGPRCSQLSYNTATALHGGGVYVGNNSTVNLRQIFIEGNSAALGGGIYAFQSQVILYNVLVAGNNATDGTGDGLRLYTGASLTGAHNTFAHNDADSATTGRAIDMSGATLTLSNSIVWGHASSINDTTQTVTCSNIQGGYTGTGNLNVNPLFVAPASADFHLQATSPVMDRCATGQSSDFDNEPRPVVRTNPATPYDMGADEFSAPRVGINGGGCAYGTVSQAVAAAASGDTLQVATDTFFETVDITDKDLTIVGNYESDCITPGAGPTILDASYHSGSAVDIRNNVVTLRNLRITGSDDLGGGVDADAGLDDASQVTLDNIHITGNTGTYGAGLYVGTRTVVTLTNGTRINHNAATVAGGGARVWGKLVMTSWLGGITENTAPHGGGVSVPGGRLEMRPGHVGINQATAADGRGGGIHVLDGGMITATASSNVYRNSAHDGGGIYADDARVTLGAVIHSNTAANDGGGIYLTNGSALYADSTRLGDTVAGRHNEATAGAGGGIYAQDSTIEFNGRIYNNRAATQGGGIFATSSTIALTDAHVGGTGENQANDITDGIFGAGLYFSATQALLSNTVVASNTFSSGAGWGGGIVAWNGSVVTLTESSRVEQHYAPNVGWFGGGGAGVLVYGSTVTLNDSQVLSNTADYFGGGIYMVLTSTLNILNGSSIAHNHVITGSGGGIAAVGMPNINIANTTLSNNSAGTDGGAIHITAGTLDFTDGWNVVQNTAGGNGGAVAVLGTAEANFRAGGYSFVYFNQALNGHGGMLYLGNNTTTQLRATAGHEMYIYGNRAIGGNGGALYADNGGYFDIYGEVNFDRNRADNGGAIYVSNGARVWLDDYVNIRPQLWDNWADSGSGGAIYAVDSPRVACDGATFGLGDEGNHASVSGGAIYLDNSDFDADNCIFQYNEARQHGGAIAAYNNATLSIYATYPAPSLMTERAAEIQPLDTATILATTCDPRTQQCSGFSGNVADSDANDTGDGGALYTSNSTLRLSHTYLHRNSAYRGGAIYQTGASAEAQVANSLIYSNTVSFAIGAGIRTAGGVFTITQTTIANNQNGAGYSQISTSGYISNSIAWGNTDGGFWVASGTLTGTCNIDQNNEIGVNVDPLFAAPGAGENYRLRSGSPAIDACATGLSPDLANIARPYGSAYDMGAYEYALGLAFTPDRSGSGSSPGVVAYTHTLTNASAAPDIYSLAAHSSNGWSATFAPAAQIALDGGQSTAITITLSIPAGVVSGTVDTLLVTATSGADPSLTASITNTTTVMISEEPVYRLYLPLVLRNHAP